MFFDAVEKHIQERQSLACSTEQQAIARLSIGQLGRYNSVPCELPLVKRLKAPTSALRRSFVRRSVAACQSS